uniref:thioredoxin fold domain-containing protein n=1 Tax=Pseudoalteromonas sp. TaxID=53249 RepID=UPI003D2C68A9
GQLLLFAGLYFNISYWWPTAAPATTTAVVTENKGFDTVSTLDELQQRVANNDGRYTLVDLYADWCIACKEFEHLTFPKPQVQAQMQKMQLIKVDVTKMTRKDQALLDHYRVLGLPTLLVFNPQGEELTQARITGFMNANDFANHLQQVQQ